jgi:hypothetical protein
MAMTMFNPIPTPFTLLIVILTGYTLSTRAEAPLCFYPDGSQAQSDHACHLTSEFSFCCAIGDNCLDNKLCVTKSDDPQPYNRGSCTDKTWNSPECPRFCLDFSSDGGTWLVNCGDKGVCCFDVLVDRPEDCCSVNSSAHNPVLTLNGEATFLPSSQVGRLLRPRSYRRVVLLPQRPRQRSTPALLRRQPHQTHLPATTSRQAHTSA